MLRVRFRNDSYSNTAIRSSVESALGSSLLCSMATIVGAHRPHLHTAYFSWNASLHLFFISHPRSTHGQHLARPRRAAVTVFDTRQPWARDHFGLQLFGRCSLAHGKDVDAAQRAYRRRFPELHHWLNTLKPAERAAFPSRFYVFTPNTLKLLDEARFGEETFVLATIDRP